MSMNSASSPPREDTPSSALCAYCGELFTAEAPSIEAIRQPIREAVRIEAHEHADALQLTWLHDCAGRALARESWHGVNGRSALVAYPGDRHGYELVPLSKQSEAVLVKLTASRGSALCKARPLPDVVTSLPDSPRLSAAIERLNRDVAPTREAVPQWLADAVSVLTLWPRRVLGGAASGKPEADLAESDPAIEAALSLIESRLGDPPALAEMAKAAHLSERQFCRRFQRSTGRTPHAYLTERRLARAKALLSDARLSAGKVAILLGFTSPAVFTRWFRQHVGQPPGAFRIDPTRF